MSRLGEMIRKQRQDSGLTLKRAAKLCGVAESYLSDVEEGRRIIADDLAARMLRKLGVASPVEAAPDLFFEASTPVEAAKPAPEPGSKNAHKPMPQKELKAPEPGDEKAGERWIDALSGVLRRVPVFEEGGLSQETRVLPAMGGVIEGAPADKVFYVRVAGEELTGYRLAAGDLVLCVPAEPGAAIVGGALHAVLLNGKTILRRLTRVDGNQAVVESQRLGELPKTLVTPLAGLKILGLAVRAEFSLRGGSKA